MICYNENVFRGANCVFSESSHAKSKAIVVLCRLSMGIMTILSMTISFADSIVPPCASVAPNPVLVASVNNKVCLFMSK